MTSPSFMMQLSNAYQAGLYTDLKIICGDREFLVHKIILCSQSPVFHKRCSGGSSEATSGVIHLSHDIISLVSRMVDCLYNGTYKDFMETDDHDWKSAHWLHAAMYALGDKFDIAVLKHIALVNFNEHATKYGKKDILQLIECIPLVYSSTPDSDRALRDATVEKIKARPSRFLNKDVKESYQKVLIEVPEFSWDLHQYWMGGAHEVSVVSGSNKRRR